MLIQKVKQEQFFFSQLTLSANIETKENGLLENSAILAVIALKSEISDALLEIGELVHCSSDPQRKITLGWRPEGIRIARERLNQTAIKSAILENLYVKGEREVINFFCSILLFQYKDV